jgi:EAL domain-containing protein (putative c-di-GMP-specific phosphodiesterase class I)
LTVGRDLSLAVIATGIETDEQLSALQALGCTMAQGPFMGEPTAADEVRGLFDVRLPLEASTSTAFAAESRGLDER